MKQDFLLDGKKHRYAGSPFHCYREAKFEDHQTLKSQMQPGKANVDKGCQNVYKLLETKSRDARYEVDPVKAITAQDVIFVNGWAKYIKDWATKHLTADGYTCT